MLPIESVEELNQGAFDDWYVVPFTCGHCKDVNIAHFRLGRGWVRDPFESVTRGHVSPQWFPKRVSIPNLSVLPDHIAGAGREAYETRSMGSYRSSILMARAVIEAICKDKGITNGRLNSKIDQLAERGLILQSTKDEAHEIRYLGNFVAHADFATQPDVDESDESEDSPEADFALSDVDESDADDVLDVLQSIIDQIYVTASRSERMRSRRGLRKANGS